MSYYIANTIKISKDFKTFRVKGGDNNVIPRSNNWSSDTPIEELFDLVSGGMLEIRSNKEKDLFINKLVTEGKKNFGSFENGESYYSLRRIKPVPQKVVDFDMEFLKKLKEGLKTISNKKEYIVMLNGSYILKQFKNKVSTTDRKEYAEKFGKYMVQKILSRYKNYSSEVFKVS